MKKAKLVVKCLLEMIQLVEDNPEYFHDGFDDDIITMAQYCIELLESE